MILRPSERSPKGAYTLGIDIGGTKTVVGSVSPEGQLLAQTTIPTQSKEGWTSGLKRLEQALDRVTDETRTLGHPSCLGIGIGAAGPVHPLKGTLNNPFTLPGWEDVPIVQDLSQCRQLPVFLENDADAALMGEMFFGAGRDFQSAVMLTFGTGIGGAFWVNGDLLRGVEGVHPEIGHLKVCLNGPECYCGQTGCWESWCSGTAIQEASRTAGYSDFLSLLESAERKDPRAVAVANDVMEKMKSGIWTLLHVYAPEVIILGGGVIEGLGNQWIAPVTDLVQSAGLVEGKKILVKSASLGNRTGCLGAGALAWKRIP